MKSPPILMALMAVSVLSVTALIGCATPPPANPAAEAEWRKLLAKVKVGMRRETVEEVLSRTDAADIVGDREIDAMFASDGHNSIYLLDEDWCAGIAYGSAFRETNNPHQLVGFPNHPVLLPPKLLRRTPALDRKIKRYGP